MKEVIRKLYNNFTIRNIVKSIFYKLLHIVKRLPNYDIYKYFK